MKDDDTTACNLLSGYASNRVLRNEMSINCLLTDTSQFHTYGLGGGICGLSKTILSRMSESEVSENNGFVFPR